MTFKVSTSKSFEQLIGKEEKKNIIGQVRKEFSKQGPVKVKQAIVKDMIRGVSPVQGGGKWKKYSDNYKKEIRRGSSKRMRSAKPTKFVSPVNLRLTGALHRSLTSFLKGKVLFIQFKNFLADIHNRRGAGKSKVVRRMLPTNQGEQFNRTINKVLLEEMRKAVAKVTQRF